MHDVQHVPVPDATSYRVLDERTHQALRREKTSCSEPCCTCRRTFQRADGTTNHGSFPRLHDPVHTVGCSTRRVNGGYHANGHNNGANRRVCMRTRDPSERIRNRRLYERGSTESAEHCHSFHRRRDRAGWHILCTYTYLPEQSVDCSRKQGDYHYVHRGNGASTIEPLVVRRVQLAFHRQQPRTPMARGAQLTGGRTSTAAATATLRERTGTSTQTILTSPLLRRFRS